MGQGSDDRRTAIRAALLPGARVRVDWKHEGLRRSFRETGTVIEVLDRDEGGFTLTLEVRPRFGAPARQPIEGDAIVEVTPA